MLKYIFKKKKEEVFVTYDAGIFRDIQYMLKEKEIPYITKIVNTGSRERGRNGMLGQIGENLKYQNMYYIYVESDRAQEVREVINKYRR